MKKMVLACLMLSFGHWAPARMFESFEYSSYPPGGWVKTNLQGGSGWYRLPVGVAPLPGWGNGTSSVPPTAGAGGYVAYCTWNTGGGASEGYHNDQWLISPKLTGLCATSSLSFWIRFAFTNYPDTLYVRISTNTANPADFTRIIHTNRFERGSWPTQFPPWSNAVVALGNLGIPAGTPLYIAFQEYEWDNTRNGAALQLDVISSDLTAPPEPRLSATQLVFTATYNSNPPAQAVTLGNAGSSDNLAFSHAFSCGPGAAGWASMSPAAGTVAGSASQSLTFQVAPIGMGTGSYYAINTLTMPGASNSPLQVRINLSIAKGNQAIVFPALGPRTTTQRVALQAAAGSGLPVRFAVLDGPGVLEGGSNLSFTGAGTVRLLAMQDGNANWNPAPHVTQTVAVVKSAQAELLFTPASPQVYGTTQTLAATGGSGYGALSYTVVSGPGHITGGSGLTVTAGTGTSVVVAAKAADALYEAASVTAEVVACKARAPVTLHHLNQVYNGAPRVVTASADPSGVSVRLTYDGVPTPPVNAGTYRVVGTVDDESYTGAATGTLAVSRADQSIAFPPLPDQVVTSTVILAATASSALPVSFAVQLGPGFVAERNRLSFYAVGAVTLAARQEGDANWNPAWPVYQSVWVHPAIPRFSGIRDADFDGDGLADPAVYDALTGDWTVRGSGSGYAAQRCAALLGGPTWRAAAADYDGDGLADPAVYREVTGDWMILRSGSGYGCDVRTAFMGGPGWTAASADFDGDSRADYAVVEEASGTWDFKLSSARYAPRRIGAFLGGPGAEAIPADYDGDRLADPAVYQRADGTWALRLTGSGFAGLTAPRFLGGPGWDPVPGDYDGDGLADPAVRSADGSRWRVRMSGRGYDTLDIPLGL